MISVLASYWLKDFAFFILLVSYSPPSAPEAPRYAPTSAYGAVVSLAHAALDLLVTRYLIGSSLDLTDTAAVSHFVTPLSSIPAVLAFHPSFRNNDRFRAVFSVPNRLVDLNPPSHSLSLDDAEGCPVVCL